MTEMMTEAEHKAMEMTAELFNHISQNVMGHDPEARTGDMREVVSAIHDVQRIIMSQAACRVYPNRYRLLGERIPTKSPDEAFECTHIDEHGRKCYNAIGHHPLYPHLYRESVVSHD